MKPEGFPPRLRLRKRREFLRVQRKGRKLQLEHFLVFAAPLEASAEHRDDLPPTRLGITVTRKVGNAVTRNRIKRLVREAFRRNQVSFPRGFDVVFVAKRGRVPGSYAEVASQVQNVAKRLGGSGG